MTVHVYTALAQPLTRYNIGTIIGVDRWRIIHRRKVFQCSLCYRRRWAKNLSIQVYYDMLRVFCKDGCK